MIFSFGILRDNLYVYLVARIMVSQFFMAIFFFSYHRAILEQPKQAILPAEYATIVPAVLFILGQIFVVTSTWQLGITGTFLGDYFGILKDNRVEGYVARLLARISLLKAFFCTVPLSASLSMSCETPCMWEAPYVLALLPFGTSTCDTYLGLALFKFFNWLLFTGMNVRPDYSSQLTSTSST